MTDLRKAAEMALEALEICFDCVPLGIEKWTTAKEHKVRSADVALRQALDQPECNPHPDAPHGFNRESSHSLGRYVCDCEGWEPEEQEPVAWWNPRYGKGEYAFAEEQSPPDDSNDPSDFGWNIPLYTAPPKPAQDLIVGYADSHDIARDGHDFWVSRQPRKNTVPLYLYGHPPKIWQGLTDEDIAEGARQSWVDKQAFESAVWWAEEKLKDKNRG